MTWGKRARGTTTHRRHKNRLPHIALAALLAASLLPAIPLNQPAEAAEGTARYDQVFAPQNIFGTPGNISGSTMRLASTKQSSYYEKYDGSNTRGSCSAFASNKPVSLNHSWEIVFSGSIPNLQTYANIRSVDASFSTVLARGPLLNSTTALCWKYVKVLNKNPTTYHIQLKDAFEIASTKANETAVAGSDNQIRFKYDAQLDAGTLTIGSTNQTYSNIRAFCGDSAYLLFVGIMQWTPTDLSQLVPSVPPNLELSATFNSMTIPNLDPKISDIQLYRINPATSKYDVPVGKDDELAPDEIVRAVCVVRNTNNSSVSSKFSEQFNLHLKLTDTDAYPTQGIEPFADAAHPLQVDGKTVATASGDDTLTGANGIALTLVGTTPVEVSYYARVNQGSAAVSVSHELIEDSFQGSQFKTVELLPKRALVPGDPDDPTLKPGTDYHYTRLPAANENGWNGAATSPVDVTFYAGDFNRFTVAGANGATLGTLSGGQKWTQSADVDALPVTYQATNTVSSILSTTGEDTIRIDTQPPALSYDAGTGTLSADDTGSAGKATSGIWKVERVKADGRPLSAEDITPQASTAAEPLIPDGTSAVGDEQASWDFPLADGKGSATQTVANAQPGFYVSTDAAGNRSAVFEAKEPEAPVDPGPDEPTPPVDPTPDNPNPPVEPAPDDPNKPVDPTPDNPNKPGPGDSDDPKPPAAGDPDSGSTDPSYPIVTPKPTDNNPDPAPLKPTKTERDPNTGLVHVWVEDVLTLPCSPKPVSPDMTARLIAERYTIGAGAQAASISASEVTLLDAQGRPVDAIDRTTPGTWYAEQIFADAQGNRTTLRLTITVKQDAASGSLSSTSGSSPSSSDGDGTTKGASDRTGDLKTTVVSALPQTGGILGPCPLHPLFALLAAISVLYTFVRLRQNRRRREQQTPSAAAASRLTQPDETAEAQAPSRRYTALDALVHGLVMFGALFLAALAFCAYDGLLAVGTVALTLFCTWRLARNPQRERPPAESTEQPA